MTEVIASEVIEGNVDSSPATTVEKASPAKIEEQVSSPSTEASATPQTSEAVTQTDDTVTSHNDDAIRPKSNVEKGAKTESTTAGEQQKVSTDANKSKSLEKRSTHQNMNKRQSFSAKFKRFFKKLSPKAKSEGDSPKNVANKPAADANKESTPADATKDKEGDAKKETTADANKETKTDVKETEPAVEVPIDIEATTQKEEIVEQKQTNEEGKKDE